MNDMISADDRLTYQAPQLVRLDSVDATGKDFLTPTEFTPGSSYGPTAAPS